MSKQNDPLQYVPDPRLKYVEESLIGLLFTEQAETIFSRVYPDDIYHKRISELYELVQIEHNRLGHVSPSIIYDKAEQGELFLATEIQTFERQAMDERADTLIIEIKDFVRKREQHKALTDAMRMLNNPKVTATGIYEHLQHAVSIMAITNEIIAHNLNEIQSEIEAGTLGKRLDITEPVINEFYSIVGSHTHTTEVHVARSKHGKTTYACYRAAMYANQGMKGVYFTLEGSRFDIYEKLKGQVSAENFDNIIVVDSAQTATEITAKMYELKIKEGIEFCVVDYVQRIQNESERYKDETQRVADASMSITNATLKNGLYSLILAQPRKLPQDRNGWKAFPEIDDIYGSGQVVKDAYVVTGGFRPLLIKGLYYRHMHGKDDGVLDHKGKIVSKNSYFVRMLICRRGEMKNQTIRFLQEGEHLKIADFEGFDAGDYLRVE